jgi:hypothetical protein
MTDHLYADPRTGLPVIGDPAAPDTGTIRDTARNVGDRVLDVIAADTPEGNALVVKFGRMADPARTSVLDDAGVLALVAAEPYLRKLIVRGWEMSA